MDRRTVFTKTAKGLMEATGKTSVLSRDMRALLKEIDGKATVGDVQNRLGKLPEAKLQEALNVLAKSDFIREFMQVAQPAAPKSAAPPPQNAGESEMDLDFTVMIPTVSTIAKQAEEAARQKAQAEAAAGAKAEAEARAKAEALEKAKAAAAAAARTRAEAEARAKAAVAEAAARAKAEAEAKAKAKAKAEVEARAKAEAEARAKAAAEAAARAKAEAEAKARAEAEEKARAAAAEAAARAKAEAAARAQREAEERARHEAEEKARLEAAARAKAEEQARIEAEARARKETEERARVEAELRAKLEEERKAREEAERRAKEEAERERREAGEKAQHEADVLRASLEQERKAREDAERGAREQAERSAREQAAREARELAAREARELAEREAREHAEREAKEQAGHEAKERARKEAEERARVDAGRKDKEGGRKDKKRERAERREKERAAREAKEQAQRAAREAAERTRKEQEELARREAETKAREEAERRKARKEAEEKSEAEERARKDAEEKARREAEKQAQAPVAPGSALDDLIKIDTDFDAMLGGGSAAKQEAEAQARRDAEEQAKAQEGARKAAEEEARRAQEERRRKDEQEQQRKDEAERQRRRAEEQAREEPVTPEREHAEAQARLDAQNEETERHFAEMEKEIDAESATAAAKGQKLPAELPPGTGRPSKDEGRARVRAEAAAYAAEAKTAAEAAPPAYRAPVNWGKPVALSLFVLLVLALVLVHFVSFDGAIPQFEKLAGAHLQQPVKIKTLHLSLVPLPHWRLEGVSVGSQGELAVARIKAVAGLGSLFGDKKVFTSIELDSPVLSEAGLAGLLFGKPQGQDFKVASVIVKNGKLVSKTIVLPALDAKISMGEGGAWQKIALETPDHKTSLTLEPKGEGAQLEFETNSYGTPFGPAFVLENFSAKGMVGRNEFKLSEFKGGIHGAYLSGNVSLKWGADWSLGGEVNARAMDPGKIAPALLEGGKLEGKAQFAVRAKSYAALFAAPRLEGSFAVGKGTVLGVDLARLLQGGGAGGKTSYTELTGSFVRDGGKTQLRQIHLAAGPLSAGGSADVDASDNISGRFVAEIKSPVAQARANLGLSGNLKEPRFSR